MKVMTWIVLGFAFIFGLIEIAADKPFDGILTFFLATLLYREYKEQV